MPLVKINQSITVLWTKQNVHFTAQ